VRNLDVAIVLKEVWAILHDILCRDQHSFKQASKTLSNRERTKRAEKTSGMIAG
jgi:hypothetical protein